MSLNGTRLRACVDPACRPPRDSNKPGPAQLRGCVCSAGRCFRACIRLGARACPENLCLVRGMRPVLGFGCVSGLGTCARGGFPVAPCSSPMGSNRSGSFNPSVRGSPGPVCEDAGDGVVPGSSPPGCASARRPYASRGREWFTVDRTGAVRHNRPAGWTVVFITCDERFGRVYSTYPVMGTGLASSLVGQVRVSSGESVAELGRRVGIRDFFDEC